MILVCCLFVQFFITLFLLSQLQSKIALIQNNNSLMRAVQLIAFDSSKNPYIPQEALHLLRSLHTPSLHVIAVAGKYRTGKSYILNRVLLGRNHGFNVGHTINACTKGLWMWPELVQLNGKSCLIIDTEGLGSLQEGESTDLKIFLLALLFSSQLIYNSVGSIDEQAIESLSLVIQLATVLQKQDKYDSQELVNTFPAFMWLIRDFSLKLQTEQGVPISPSEYLEQALKHQSRTSQAAQRKNQIRKQLRTFFQQRDCFALVRPTEEEKDLQNLSMVDDNKLRPEFVGLVQGLKKRLGQSVKPKRVRGRTLSTEGFIELCQYYTKALIDGKLPTISSHWDNLCLAETHRIFQKFQLEHLKALESQSDDLSKMMVIHKGIIKQGMQAIDKSFLGKLQKQLFKQRFQRKIQGQFQQIRSRANSRKSEEVRLMLENMQESGVTCPDDPLMRYEAVIMKMSQIAETSTKDQNHYCELYLYLCEFARTLIQDVIGRTAEQQSLSNAKLLLLEEQLAVNRTERQRENETREEELQELRRKISQYHSNNQKVSNEKREQSLAQLFEYQSKIKEMTQNINTLQQTLFCREAQIQKLKNFQQDLITKCSDLQQRLFQSQKTVMQKEALTKLQVIRCRKITREKEIIKLRYQENLEEGLQLRAAIDALEKQVAELENKAYLEGRGASGQGVRVLTELRMCRQENKYLGRLLREQRTAYEAILQLPQNISYQALKRNLQLEHQEKCELEEKINEITHESGLDTAAAPSGAPFNENTPSLSKKISKKDSHYNIPTTTDIIFDVSYVYNDNSLTFEIQMSNGITTWQMRRSWNNLKRSILSIHQTIQQEEEEYYDEEEGCRDERLRLLVQELFNNHTN